MRTFEEHQSKKRAEYATVFWLVIVMAVIFLILALITYFK